MRRIRLVGIAAGLVFILVSCSTAKTPQEPTSTRGSSPPAEAVLKRMARVYISVKSYADSGEVYDYRNGVREPDTMSFRIHFVRPDHLRFEMTKYIGSPYFPKTYYVLWSYGNATYTWCQSYPQIETCRDVTSAITQFTGISDRSVHNIPSLLQTNFGWQEYLYHLTSPRILGEEVFEQADCYRIQGGGKGERQFEIWLGKSDYLIRKIRTTYPGFSSEEIHRGIAINEPTSPDMLSFTPPMSIENQRQN